MVKPYGKKIGTAMLLSIAENCFDIFECLLFPCSSLCMTSTKVSGFRRSIVLGSEGRREPWRGGFSR